MKKKRILALACSPSKGFNSDTMLDSFIMGIKENPAIEVKKIYLIDLEISHYTFFNKVPNQKDDRDLIMIVNELKKADGLVIGTPCFNFNVPATLKNLLDRLSFMALDYKKLNWCKEPTGKLTYLKNYYLVSCGSPAWMVKLFLWPVFPLMWLKIVFNYYGSKNIGGFYGAGLNTNNLAKNNLALLEKCKKAGRNYAKKILNF